MKTLLFALLIFIVSPVIAQTAHFNNSFVLRNGIYTSHNELLHNAPSFPDCVLKANENKNAVNKDELNYYTEGNENYLKPFTSELFAMVQDGKLFIYYQKQLIPAFSKGTLCRFIYTRETNLRTNNQNQAEYKSDVCIADIQTGSIYVLSKENLGKSIQRDATLYTEYLKVNPGSNNKNLIVYINDFNTRNPTSIPTQEQTATPEE